MKQASIRYRHMAWLFARIGASSFGGWAAAVVLIKKELVKRRGLLTTEQLDGAVAYAQMLPGAVQVSIVAHVGYRLRGVVGACVATASYLALPISLIAVFSMIYFRFLHDSPQLMNQLDGVIAALGGVILANAYRIGSHYASKLWLWLLVGLALFLRLQFNVSPLLIILIYAFSGLLVALLVLPWNGPKGDVPLKPRKSDDLVSGGDIQ